MVNKQKKGHLTVVKHVANHGIGSSAAGDFTIKVVDANGHEQSFTGAEAGTAIDIDPGAYDVSETGPSGYAMTLSGCGTDMTSNGSATCTVTNSDIPTGQGAITVIKQFINDNGGSALASAFNAYLKITPEGDAAFAVNSGAANFLDAGNYTVTEDDTTLLNYTLDSISCTDGDATNGGVIALADQAAWVCTVTNDDIAPHLTLVKEVTNNDGGHAVAADWTLTATGPSTISGAGGAESGATFQAGTYTLSESAGPAGYTAGSWSCTNDVSVGEGNTITLGIGQSTTCTIVNDDQPGTLHIVKHVINDNGGTKTANDFSFKVNNGEPTAFTQDGENALLGQNDVVLPAGTYTVTEVAADGYGSSSDGCSNIELTNGGEATCTFTNNDGQATLTLVKNTQGADGSFDFSLVAGEFSTTSEIATVEGTGSKDVSIDAGTYDVTENIPAGWTLSDRFCYVYNTESNTGEGIQNGVAVTLVAGDHIVCTFDNTATGADLSIDKTVDDTTPDQNQNITYTLTAHNAGPTAIAGVEVTDVLPAGLEFVSADGDYATTTGIWTIGTLTAGSTTTMHIVAKVTGAKGSTIENGATISGNDEGISDYNEENDTGSVGVTVNNPATPPSGGGGGGGGNGPIVGSLGGGGQVLGISTSTPFGAACEKYLFKFIKYGSKTNDPEQVKRLQYVLGTLEGYNVPQNGVFDKATYDAVHAFQTKYGDKVLTPWGLTHSTGYVYLTTRKMVNEVYCKGASFPLTAEEQKIVDDYRARGNAGGAPAAPKQTPAPVAPAAPKQPEATAPVQDAGTVNVELPGTTGTGDEAQAGAAATPAPTTSVIDRIKNFFGGLFH